MLIVENDLRRAIVTEDLDGPVIRYERRTMLTASWFHDRTCRPAVPYHVALDVAHRQVHHRPDTIGRR